VEEAAPSIRPVMCKGASVPAAVPARGLDFDDQRPTLRQKLAAKKPRDLLGKLKDADTGER
jgi:hypothetical protein